MYTIVVANQKGGTGKSTSALAIYDCLREVGARTLFVDTEQQCNSTSCFDYDLEGKNTLYDVLKKNCTTNEAILSGPYGDIIPGDPMVAGLELELFTKVGGINILSRALKEVDEQYDFCIIDTPPNLGSFLLSALIASSYVIIPINADKFSIDGLQNVIKTVNDVHDELNPNLKIAGVLLTKYDMRNGLDKSLWFQLRTEDIGVPVFKKPIRVCQDFKESHDRKIPLSVGFPKSKAHQDYIAVVNQLMEVISNGEK